MLTCLYNNLTDDGVGLITVPSFEYITDHNTYYELIHDHLAYYTFDSLTYLLNQNGFIVESKEMINRDTLSVMVKKTKTPISQVSSWKDFTKEITALGDSLASIREQMKALSEVLQERILPFGVQVIRALHQQQQHVLVKKQSILLTQRHLSMENMHQLHIL